MNKREKNDQSDLSLNFALATRALFRSERNVIGIDWEKRKGEAMSSKWIKDWWWWEERKAVTRSS